MTEVMLMADVKYLGKAGEIVKVAPGYARNMLLPQGLAAPVTEASKRRLAKLEAQRAAERKARKAAAEALGKELEARGEKVVLADLAREDMAECVEDAFRYDRLVLASVTYNGDIFPCMHAFLHALTERSYQNRTVAFMENGTWAPAAARVMAAALEKSKNLTFAQEKVTIKSAMNAETLESIRRLAEELAG